MPGTTPVYGFPYPEPTDLVADYPALGQQLAEDVESALSTNVGLRTCTPSSIANSGGTATLSGNTVTFTTVNSVSLNGVFSSLFNDYFVIANVNGSAATALYMRTRVSGSDETGANYNFQQIVATGTSLTAARTSSQTAAQLGAVRTSAWTTVHCVIASPNLVENTRWSAQQQDADSTISLHIDASVLSNTTQYTGLTLLPGTGTISGRVAVYGLTK